MPFTFSHPAIVLPFRYFKPKWFSATGLVTGSIAPDCLYFVKMDGSEDFGHTLAGIFLFDLPVSYLLAFAFHRWVRNPFLVHLPTPLGGRYAGYLTFDFANNLLSRPFLFPLSVLLGAFSHIGWDNFCSPRGWIFYADPSFFNQAILLPGGQLRLYVLMERIGSALGLVFLLLAALRTRKPAANVPATSTRAKVVYWSGLLITTLFFAGLKFWFGPSSYQLAHTVLIITSAACYATGFIAAVYALLAGPHYK